MSANAHMRLSHAAGGASSALRCSGALRNASLAHPVATLLSFPRSHWRLAVTLPMPAAVPGLWNNRHHVA